jgi:hypothetical protein
MNRETIKNLKTRAKCILKGDYNTIDLDDTYLLATGDYQVEEMEEFPLNNLRPPLWDWFSIFNKKNKKVWYIDFSCPYLYESFNSLTEKEKINIAVIDLYYKYAYDMEKDLKNLFPINGFKKEKDYYENMKDYYKNYNNWDLTFQIYNQKMQENKNWDENIIVLHENKQDFCVIMPHRYLEKDDMTMKDVFKEILEIIKSGKVKQKHENKKYKKLIDEINFTLNLFNKENNIERFI